MALPPHILEQPGGLVYGALMAFRAVSARPAGIPPLDVGGGDLPSPQNIQDSLSKALERKWLHQKVLCP